jgi:diguanylate cyclase (GGDEF)-like protein/PAS domain S-box-containing protein
MQASLHLTPEELAALGYTDLSLISETESYIIYHAYTHDGEPLFVKTPVTNRSSHQLSDQLEHELKIAHKLNPECVLRPIKTELIANHKVLLLEACQCPPLTELLTAPVKPERFLGIAIGITDALSAVHRSGLIHKAIKPDNIYVMTNDRVKLTGFGIASKLIREWQPLTPLEHIVGDLAYMAPEQTGRMNRSIDTRSDLYALGVVFYQMLTGRLPFAASDPMAWVHSHIAIQPRPPRELLTAIPAPLSDIVMKLLAKAAEERYQTTEGLKTDLKHCLDEWLAHGTITPFRLGRLDIPQRLVIPEKLYGRKHELEKLLSTVERVVSSGNSEMLLVSGYSGIGKSALINEMHQSLVSPKTLFAEGKFDQYKRDTPYANLAQALQTLVQQILGQREREIAQWRENLNKAVAPNGRLVTDLVPDLVTLIGPQPAVAKVPLQDAQNRFNQVIRRFIQVFAQADHPLVLFLDDLQWLDAATLQLLEYLLTHPRVKHLLLLGAYRNNEVRLNHPLRRTIEMIRQSGGRLSEIGLNPLTKEDVCQLIGDSLHTDTERTLPLARLVQEKTGGNPFFVTQFLTALSDEQLLAFDTDTGEWQWELECIHAQDYSDNVADLMSGKLGSLPDETQQALKRFACLGTAAEIGTLAKICEQSEEVLHSALWEAVQAGLVLRLDEDYHFLHDRVQEAAYQLIPQQERAQYHLDIGRKLLTQSPAERIDHILFDVVNHLNQGKKLMVDPGERIRLAELNASAGRRARASIAYATARELFAAAAAILPETAWKERYAFQFTLYCDWAEAEYLFGDYAQAEHLFSMLLARAKNDLDRIRVHRLRMTLYPIAGQYDDALAAGIEALRLLGEAVPEDDEAIEQAIAVETTALKRNLQGRSIGEITQAPEVADPQARIMIDLLTAIGGPAYIGSRPQLYPLFAYMNINRVLQYGITNEACHALSGYAVLEVSTLGDFNAAYEASQAAIHLSERFAEPGTIGSTLYLQGNHINFWLNPFNSDMPILERGFRACADAGNLAFANYIGYSIVWQAIERGDALGDVLDFSRSYASYALESRNEAIRYSIVLEQQFLKCLMGKTDGEISFSDDSIDEFSCVDAIDKGAFTCGLTYYHTMKMLAAYLMGDDTAAQSHADEAWRVHSAVLSQPMQAMFYFVHALILSRIYDSVSEEERGKTLETLEEHLEKLAFWAKKCPANFACKHALAAAELAVVKTDTLSAERLFEQASEAARSNGFIHWQAIASEAAARFHAKRGLATASRAFLREARDCYERWGATAKVRQLTHRYHWLDQGQPLSPASLGSQLDAALLIKASQRLSGDIELPKLIQALMTITLESAGADRGLLLLGRDNRFEVEVEATISDAEILVKQVHAPIDQTACPETVINRAVNSRKSVFIDDASSPNDFSGDRYLHQGAAKSILCLPLLRQDNLTGLLYLENRQTPGAFTHDRAAVLDVLASQAAISLENAYLYHNLRESETKFRTLVQKIQAAVIVHGADTQVVIANAMAQDLLGLNEAQLLGKTAIDPDWHFLREDGTQLPPAEYPINQALISRKPLQNLVIGIDRPDLHKTLWALVNAVPVFDESQAITQVIVSFTDITERKLAGQQLATSEQLFRTLVENTPNHISRYDLKLRRVYINPALKKEFRVPLDKLLGKTSQEDSPLLDPESYMTNLRKVIETEQEVSDEIAYRNAQGDIRWASSRFAPEFDPHGKVQSVLVISYDITDRRIADQQLANAKQMYQTLVENLPDCVARFDANGRHLFVNTKVEKTFGMDRETFLKRSLIESKKLGSDKQNRRIQRSIKRVFESGKPEVIEAQWETVEGTRSYEIQHVPEFNEQGNVNSVLSIAHDVTLTRQAERRNREHLQFLQSLDHINQLLQEEGDMEGIMNRALKAVLDIFDCDRAYLIYPCDPDAETWSVPMESTRPEYPGAGLQHAQPMEEELALVMQALLESDHPLRIGPGSRFPITPLARDQFNTRSVMATMLRPRVDKPWQFGIQQCSHERIWSDQEVRLFEEIGHRLSDGLNSLLIARNLRESEERFRLVFESSPVSIQQEDYSAVKTHLEALRPQYGEDLAGFLAEHPEVVEECAALVRVIDINHAALALHEADSKQAILNGLPQIFVSDTLDGFRNIVVSLMQGERTIRRESVLQTLQGRRYSIDAFITVCPGYEESLEKILVSLIDITELKKAEHERQQHLYFLESLDRVNKVLQAEGDVEQTLSRILDVVLDIFDCDRAYLQYPCDPNAAGEWRIPMERCKPDYPSTLRPDQPLPYHPHIEETLHALLDSDNSLRLGPDTDWPLPPEITEKLGVRSLMAVSLHPKVDRPWQFGIHQCSFDRIWTDQEARLLEEIGRRLSDGLNDLLVSRGLRESEERFRLVYENSPVPIWEEDFSAVKSHLERLQAHCAGDIEGYLVAHPEIVKACATLVRVVNVNSAALELHEADNKAALFEGLPKTFIPESYEAFRKELVAIVQGKTELLFDSAVQTVSGKRREVSVSFAICPGYEQSLSKVFISLFDITQRKRDEEQLRLAASVFSTSQEGILISDANNRIIDINPAFTRVTGYSREEALGKNPGFLSAGRQNPAFYAEMWREINNTGEWQGEIWNRRKSGETFPELLSVVAVKDEQGNLQHYVGAFTDISMIKQHEADLAHIAHYDMLTSVPNRRLLRDRLEQAIAHARRNDKSLAVCYLDLDGFKPINDQLGHESGDRLLIEIARRLESISRGDDTVSRLGGDEFVLLWNDIVGESDCIRALERVLNQVAKPMRLKDSLVSVSASIGVTLYPEDNVDADSLLRHADHAMYTAKQLGKNRYQIFDARLERQISMQVELMEKIGRGLDRGQFELYYQPKVDYTTYQVVGAEALLRWNDPVLGLVGPKEFLSLVENDILAFRMGRWIMEQAVRQARVWHEQGVALPISINVFSRHLKYRSFVDDLRSAIASNWPQMPNNLLLLEIVESDDLEELEPIEQVIRECLKMGTGFSLDDFGTGYSSLVYLRRLSIEELKIDQSFVRDMLEDPDDEAIVNSVISLGRAFGLRVVAEGVESSEQAEHLVKMGCPIVQGFGLGRPMPAHTLAKWYGDFSVKELTLCHKQ